MSNETAFFLGILCAGLCFGILICAYYVRALRRVRSIKEAIKRYQEAERVVGESTQKIYADKT